MVMLISDHEDLKDLSSPCCVGQRRAMAAAGLGQAGF